MNPAEEYNLNESKTYLRIKELRKSFDDKVILHQFTLDLSEGELVGLIGPSGCGKTTALRVIAGLTRPDHGQVVLNSKNITQLLPEKRSIGVVFQDFALFPHLNTIENVAFGLREKGYKKSKAKELALEYLQLVGLSTLTDHNPNQLSGGQRQRVALARSLAPQPSLLLMDEPFSNLDVQLRAELRQQLKDLLKKTHTTGILVTHDREDIFAIADRVAVMSAGQIIQIGHPQQLYQNPISKEVALSLGPCNLLPGHLSPIFKIDTSHFFGFRPETTILLPNSDGPFTIIDKRFAGPMTHFRLSIQDFVIESYRLSNEADLSVGQRVEVHSSHYFTLPK